MHDTAHALSLNRPRISRFTFSGFAKLFNWFPIIVTNPL